MRLTERDKEILRLIHEHRFIRAPQIFELLKGSPQQLSRRLKLLYHHGYVERPRAQLDYYHQGGSRHIVYGLADRGGAVIGKKQTDWTQRNRSAGRIFLKHALLVSEIMAAVELASRTNGIQLLREKELYVKKQNGEDRRFRWKVNVGGLKLTAVPDRVFALEFKSPEGKSDRAIFFLEADRGTMPVKRSHFSQTSFYRKMLAYEATWSQSIHQKRFGFNRFRVLTVTTSAERVKSLLKACAELRSGQGLFLFADKDVLKEPAKILGAVWKSGKTGEAVSLF
jgi:DNA-binding Lrp family transcriptional regulator